MPAMLLNPRRASSWFLAAAIVLALSIACAVEAAQDFEVELFDGAEFRLSEEYDDSVVVINFWYPSCAPCREEMPEFQKAWEELNGERVRFLGLFVPLGFDNEHTARQFVDELELTFDFATDQGAAISTAYGVELYPTTWFIDREGRVAKRHSGALDLEGITGIVREMMDG